MSKTPKTRTRNHGLPLIKPYTKKNDRNVRRWRIKQTTPISINKADLKRIIDEIGKEDPKPNHELISQYGTSVESALASCVLPSVELLNFNPSSIILHSPSTLLPQLRKSLLSHDWNLSSLLLRNLIQSRLINRRSLMYIIRTSLIILLNHCKHPEVLEEFLTQTLGINDERKINTFLSSIFVMPKEIRAPMRSKTIIQ